jgi:hypothetical protein
MYDLKELVLIVNRNKLRSLEQVVMPFDGQSKMGTLYDGIVSGAFDTDEEALEALYGSGESSSAYRKLKAGLRNRLLNTLFFLDVKQPSYNAYQRAYYECHRDWAVIKILLGKNARQSAVSLAKKVLGYAKQYEFSALCMDICDTLRFHYGAIIGEVKKFEQYDKAYDYHANNFQQENLAKRLYLNLVVHYVNDRSAKEEISEQAAAAYRQLEGALKESEAHQLHLYGYLIKLIIYTAVRDYRGAVEVSEAAIAFFEAKDYEAHVPLQIFYYQLMVCHIQLQAFELGRQTAARCMEQLEEGSFNWFKFQELYFILAMQTEEYEQACGIYEQVGMHPRLRFLPENIRELWRIYEAYLHYLALSGKLGEQASSHFLSHFRLGRFLNETPIYAKDKRGMNIAILIVQISLFILHKDYDKAEQCIEKVQQYCHRYLRKDETFRSSCFIKMLLLIPKNGFRRAAVFRKAKPYLQKLRQEPIEISSQTYEVEILPYEALWGMVEDSLGR